jgi:hypothetical protein
MLAGYKTYIVSAALIIIAGLSFMGIQIPGVSLPADWLVVALNGLGLGALRAAVGKVTG